MIHLLAIVPGLFVCYLIFRLDRYDREPVAALLFSFTLGALATFPAAYLQRSLDAAAVAAAHSPFMAALFAFGVVALSEELVKCAVLMLAIYPRRFFNEPLDGIVYAVLVAMGFATVENLVYAAQFGMNTTIVRAFTAVPAHLVFAIVQGYYIGLAKFSANGKSKAVWKGLVIAVMMHGIYDFLILQALSEWLAVLGSVSVYICLYYCGSLIREHLDNSPFRPQHEP